MSTSIAGIIGDVAPALATALGGPLAGAAVAFLSKELGLSESTTNAVANAVAGMTPADMVKMKELDNQFKVQMAQQGISLQLAQIAANTAEAKSTNWWVAGWRPFVGWVGAMGLLYASFLFPLMQFVATMNGYHGGFPALDTTITMQILFGLLGIGGLRTVEKVKGAEGNR
jgi:hypothetical protein